MVITDLDGTILKPDRTVNSIDYETLIKLGNKNIVRVIATGRSLFSVNKVINNNFPIDYLIFSSGAGIINWQTKQILYSEKLSKSETNNIIKILVKNCIDFMVHQPIPENHKFNYCKLSKNNNTDFKTRVKLYKDYTQVLDIDSFNNEACQILAIIKNSPDLFNEIKEYFENLKIIRTTSPIDGTSIWIEIFPKNVSKGNAVKCLCKYLKIPINTTIGIGNDYNDLDLLQTTQYSFVVSNAPKEIKSQFSTVGSNINNGFTEAVNKVFFNEDKGRK
ncbi:MAG: HAD family phosphatase [Bacteroidales bacterium]|nr:HAD family phosphatase [Bacteroidales bacterium]